MAKSFQVVLPLIAAIFVSFLGLAYGEETLYVQGKVYCDTCASFVINVSEPVSAIPTTVPIDIPFEDGDGGDSADNGDGGEGGGLPETGVGGGRELAGIVGGSGEVAGGVGGGAAIGGGGEAEGGVVVGGEGVALGDGAGGDGGVVGAGEAPETAQKESLHSPLTVKLTIHATTNSQLKVEGDHDEQICEVVLVKSHVDDYCSEIVLGLHRARVLITSNNGISSTTLHVNSLGFLKKQPLNFCPQIFRGMGLLPRTIPPKY
ncbi:hypothetical protein IFM89_012117 [Coptis chinensis]|uniref:Uncharacterized protein n=1 Tax=Coptis chinensis TaxID=261450 RepID=A0A835LZL7_9MAGN|nr:hypothetical protein IFM89_012117 [Coptis chinensis]